MFHAYPAFRIFEMYGGVPDLIFPSLSPCVFLMPYLYSPPPPSPPALRSPSLFSGAKLRSLLGRGLYALQLQPWLEAFEPGQVKVIFLEEMVEVSNLRRVIVWGGRGKRPITRERDDVLLRQDTIFAVC